MRARGTRLANRSGTDMTGIMVAGAAGVPDWVEDDGWVDVYDRYGMSLEPGGRGKLMAYAPMKQPNGSSSSTSHGVAYSGETIGITNERMLSLDVHFLAPTEEEFIRRYLLFGNEVLSYGYLQLRHAKLEMYFHLKYEDCQNFREFRLGMAQYTLTLTEPHPEIRDRRDPRIISI